MPPLPPPSPESLLALAPVFILAAGGLVLLLTEVFLTGGRRGHQAILTVLFALGAGAAAIAGSGIGEVFGGQATADRYSVFVSVTLCGGLAVSALVGAGWLNARGIERGEYYALALFSTAGMVLLGMATDLVVAFVAIEIMSIATYALAGYVRSKRRPAEAAFKYFILGAFSSALFLYGTALVFGSARSTLLSHFVDGGASKLLVAGLALITAGFAFKVGAVPFHMWTPDVYEGAPTPVTAFMAAGVKTAAFAAFARVAIAAYAGAPNLPGGGFSGVVAALAIATMILGNLLALPQRNVKRMLAYSSIAHAGYLLVAVVAAALPDARPTALAGMLFYLAAYAATVIGAFAVIAALEKKSAAVGGGDDPANAWDLSRFSGLAQRRPWLAFAMAVFMVSLAGVPPSAGFIGKLLIFQSALGAGTTGLAVVGVLSSVLGAWYYLRVVVQMYMRPAEEPATEVSTGPALALALGAAVLAVLVLGLGPQPVTELARAAAALTP